MITKSCPGTANNSKVNIIVVCNRCANDINPNEQGYYYAKTTGFCMWCANNGTRTTL